jgi:hypothetical protein
MTIHRLTRAQIAPASEFPEAIESWRKAIAESPVRATIEHLARCRAARARGVPVSFTTDPAWLVNMAINRRAGWPDDPGHTRGSAMPVNGKYPSKANGMHFNHLRLLARAINSKCIVRDGELGEWRKLIYKRIAGRITQPD